MIANDCKFKFTNSNWQIVEGLEGVIEARVGRWVGASEHVDVEEIGGRGQMIGKQRDELNLKFWNLDVACEKWRRGNEHGMVEWKVANRMHQTQRITGGPSEIEMWSV